MPSLVERVRSTVENYTTIQADIVSMTAARDAAGRRLSELRGMIYEADEAHETARSSIDQLYLRRRTACDEIKALVPLAEAAPEPDPADAELFLQLARISGEIRRRESGSGYSTTTSAARATSRV